MSRPLGMATHNVGKPVGTISAACQKGKHGNKCFSRYCGCSCHRRVK